MLDLHSAELAKTRGEIPLLPSGIFMNNSFNVNYFVDLAVLRT
jgi:hypothetical protein